MFRSSDTAISFGLKANKNDRQRLAKLRPEFIRQAESALYRERFNLAIMFATQAQLCREALDAETIMAGLK